MLVKLKYKDLCYVDTDATESALEFLMDKLGALTADVFVSLENIPEYPSEIKIKNRNRLTKIVRVWPDSNLKGDAWVLRTKVFEVHCPGA